MRIRTRLFLGSALLIGIPVALQCWLETRRLNAMEAELARVAVQVGQVFVQGAGAAKTAVLQVERKNARFYSSFPSPFASAVPAGLLPAAGDTLGARLPLVAAQGLSMMESGESAVISIRDEPGGKGRKMIRAAIYVHMNKEGGHRELIIEGSPEAAGAPPPPAAQAVPVGEKNVSSLFRHRIPLSGTAAVIGGALREGLLTGLALLAAALVLAAAVSHRVSRSLRDLAKASEQLGRGEWETRVPVTASGEIKDLQLSFNAMAERLQTLEAEKARWAEQEHLVELGALARGLAHTLRNPIHTLGLAVEELASGDARRPPEELAETARGEIRTVDRWLRSFLVLGAGPAADPVEADLGAILQDLALEAAQRGRNVVLQGAESPVAATCVPMALRAALANLLDNAAEASPAGEAVTVQLQNEDERVRIVIEDRGPGLPEEVRKQLFSPHVTTKTGGSGMGIFLARRLVEGLHAGRVTFGDRPGGGTRVVVEVPKNGAQEKKS